jgi:hypothetical protein
VIEMEQRQRIPEFGSDEHKRQIAARLSRNLRFRSWLRDLQQRPVAKRRK